MDLFDRYLHAVRSFLPKAQQEDVIRELSEELRSQSEEREASAGRPLEEAEQAEILSAWGHPLLLASRYQPQRHIVGPAAFPIYWLVLKTVLAVTLLVHVVSAAVMIAGGRPLGDLDELLFRYQPFMLAFAWVTLVFAGLERTVLRFPVFTRWNPMSLPEPSAAHSPSLWCRIAEIVMTTAFLLWLAAAPHNQWLLFGPAWRLIALGSPWFSVQLALIALVCVNLAAMVVSLRHPDPTRLRAITRIVTNVGALSVLVYLLKSPDDLIVAAGAAERAAVSLAGLLNRMARIGLAIGVLVTLIEMGRDTFRLMDGRRLWGGFARQ